jgi:hypothetical protein
MRASLWTLSLCLVLAGCDRNIDLPDCTTQFDPTDYGKYLVDTNQGLATDAQGNVWYRCKAGQTFRGKRCLGDPVYLTRTEADSFARDFSEKVGMPFRLPTKSEVKSIIESSCDSPAVNPNVFPGLSTENYWLQESSWHGERFGCSVYMYQGSVSCRQSADIPQPVLLIQGR